MRVVQLTNSNELAGLRESWNDLAGGVPFRTWDWLESWWRAYGEPNGHARAGCELFTLAVYDSAGALVGLAPWYVQRSAAQGRVLRFLGSGEVCSDYLTVLCRSGLENSVAAALARWLAEPSHHPTWDLLELSAVAADDLVIQGLVEHLAARRHVVHRRAGPSCWRIALPGTWDEYLGMLSKSHRKQLRRCERRWFETGRAQLCRVETQEQLHRGLEILATLHQRRRTAGGHRGCFASPRFGAFHFEVAARLLRSETLELSWLELDGSPVAAEYQIVGDRVVYAYQSGIEPAALDCEPGRLITMATLKQAIADGRRAFDFLRGNEPYKAHWRATPQPTQDLLIAPSAGPARLRHSLLVAGNEMKDWLNKVAGTLRVPSLNPN